MAKDCNWPAIFLVLCAGFLVAVIVYARRANNEFDARCHARGGEPVHIYKSRPLCLRPGSIIGTEEP
jgi:hypothetical protein